MTPPTLTPRQLRGFLRFAEQTAFAAGGLLKKHFRSVHRVHYKGRIDPVTEADLKSEALILARIQKHYPDHALLAEEGSGSSAAAEFRWVVDPLDGTVNYAHGFPMYCVSIALEYQGQPVVGAVFDPERKELFHGALGLGARVNKRKLIISPETNLQRALLATGFGYNVATAKRNNLGYFARMVKCAQGVRRPGSAALDICYVAAGRFDGFWELELHPWDTAAAIVFLHEAGGKSSRLDGRPYSIFDKSLVVANPKLHTAILRALKGS